jgi:AraC-like DNA-binding protein
MEAGIERLVDDLVVARTSGGTDLRPEWFTRRAEQLPPAPDAAHAALFTMRLLAAAQRLVIGLHEGAADGPLEPRDSMARCSCNDAAWTAGHAFTSPPDRDPRLAFTRWLELLLHRFDSEHPRTPAVRAAGLIRADPERSWPMAELAGRVSLGRRELRAQFRREFGLRVCDYVQLARASRALALFRTPTKVEAIALEVGYRSKKDLYASLKRWLGATPTELRALTEEERRWLESRLTEKMRWRVGAACPVPGTGFDSGCWV